MEMKILCLMAVATLIKMMCVAASRAFGVVFSAWEAPSKVSSKHTQGKRQPTAQSRHEETSHHTIEDQEVESGSNEGSSKGSEVGTAEQTVADNG